jgi:CYTH domain-containing protein
LSALPGRVVRKRRYLLEGGAVDVYFERDPVVAIFEVEFESEDEAAAYRPPSFVTREVTSDPEFSGASIAGVDRNR